MTQTEWYKRETLIYGHNIIAKLDEPERYEPHIHSNGYEKRLLIYDKHRCDAILCIPAPTYGDLYRAVVAAWNTYTLMTRGF